MTIFFFTVTTHVVEITYILLVVKLLIVLSLSDIKTVTYGTDFLMT